MEEQQDTLESRHQITVVELDQNKAPSGGEVNPSAMADIPAGESGGISSGTNKGKRKRHTQYQTDEMEKFYMNCPNPVESQRVALANRLGLLPSQVKFWFQNKRTHMRSVSDRDESSRLQAENNRLQDLNARCKEAVQNKLCPRCNGIEDGLCEEERCLRLENAQLKEQAMHFHTILASYIQPGEAESYNNPMIAHSDNNNIVSSELQVRRLELLGDPMNFIGGVAPCDLKRTIESIVAESTEVFKKMALMASGRLWTSASSDETTCFVDINDAACLTEFLNIHGPVPDSLIPECSRQTGILKLRAHQLVNILMDVDEWSAMFSNIVIRAKTLEVLNIGEAYDGALHVMVAEFQLPTPLVPNREVYFARYCQKLLDGAWTVIDVSLNDLHPVGFAKCRKKPSGCIIQDMTDETTKVTWMEHVNVDYEGTSSMYRNLLISGLGFGAKRWFSTLDGQLKRTALKYSPGDPTTDFSTFSIFTSDGRRKTIELAEIMLKNFIVGINSTDGPWKKLNGDFGEGIRIMFQRNAYNPEVPAGTILSISTSFVLPVPHIMVLDYLRNPNNRSEWDGLTNGTVVEPACHISTGQESGNYIAVHKVQIKDDAGYSNLALLQGCWSDPITSYIVYAPGDVSSLNVAFAGEDPSHISLLPCGFAVLPDGSSFVAGGSSGTLLTVSYQILVSRSPKADITFGAVSRVTYTVKQVRDKIQAVFGSASRTS